ncbi:MAG: SH3 domain-containing protein [Lachnospiraceae bacterium]|nr:SH3 domain-containing protein [Lachnospiraceae bacterium]
MRKKTLSIILDAFIVLLIIMIILLIIMIGKRGAAPMQEAKEEGGASVNPAVVSAETAEQGSIAQPTEEPQAVEEDKILCATPDAQNAVNVRSGAGTNYDKLGSAYSGEEYVVEHVQTNGWTKIDYKGQTGYIHNDYLDYYYKVTDESGKTVKEEVELSDIPMVDG